MKKDFFQFLFLESQDEAAIDARLESLFESMEGVEALEKKSEKLESILKKMGIDIDMVVDEAGISVRFGSVEAREAAAKTIFDAEAIHKLAVAGWVPVPAGAQDEAVSAIHFLALDEPSGDGTEVKDKPEDLDKLLGKSLEDATTEHPTSEAGDVNEGLVKDTDKTPQDVLKRILD